MDDNSIRHIKLIQKRIKKLKENGSNIDTMSKLRNSTIWRRVPVTE